MKTSLSTRQNNFHWSETKTVQFESGPKHLNQRSLTQILMKLWKSSLWLDYQYQFNLLCRKIKIYIIIRIQIHSFSSETTFWIFCWKTRQHKHEITRVNTKLKSETTKVNSTHSKEKVNLTQIWATMENKIMASGITIQT